MQWCPFLTGVGTTLWQVYHNIKQVIISHFSLQIKNNVFLGLTVMTIYAIFIFGTKITANIADKSSYIMIKF